MQSQFNNQHINRKVLFNFICSYIPIILLVCVVQTFFVATILQKLEKNAINVMQNAVVRDISMVEQKLQQTETLAYNVSQDSSLSAFIRDESGDFTFTEEQRIKNVLSSYYMGNTMVDNIVLQNNATDRVITPHTIYGTRKAFYLSYFAVGEESVDALINNSETAVGYNLQGVCVKADKSEMLIPFFAPNKYGVKKVGGVITYLNESMLLSALADLAEECGGAIQLYNKNGDMLLQTGPLNAEFDGEIITKSYEKRRVNGKMCCVLSQKGNYSRWRYVLVLPEKYVVGSVGVYKTLSLCFIFFSVLVGFVLCFFTALKKSRSYLELVELLGVGVNSFDLKKDEFKSLYPHISQARQENRELSESCSQNAFKMLFAGEFADENEIKKELEKCKIVLSGDKYGVLVLRYENRHLTDHFGNNFKCFLTDMFSTIVPEAYVYFVDINTTVLLFSFDYEDEQFYMYTKLVISRLECEAFLKYQIPVFFGVGAVAGSLGDIKQAYSQAVEVVSYNMLIRGYNQWIYTEFPEQKDDWYYPIELENMLFESVLEANFASAKQVLTKIQNENFVNRCLSVENINELLGELKASIKKISKMQPKEISFEFSEQSVHRFFEYAINFFYILCSDSEHVSESRGDRICSNIQSYICDNYQKPDLSISALAAMFHLNQSYLSTLFKKNVGLGLAAYIENVRIKKATQMLADGKYSIGEIAKLVGYSNIVTFRRSFKKVKGINPSEYTRN